MLLDNLKFSNYYTLFSQDSESNVKNRLISPHLMASLVKFVIEKNINFDSFKTDVRLFTLVSDVLSKCPESLALKYWGQRGVT